MVLLISGIPKSVLMLLNRLALNRDGDNLWNALRGNLGLRLIARARRTILFFLARSSFLDIEKVSVDSKESNNNGHNTESFFMLKEKFLSLVAKSMSLKIFIPSSLVVMMLYFTFFNRYWLICLIICCFNDIDFICYLLSPSFSPILLLIIRLAVNFKWI